MTGVGTGIGRGPVIRGTGEAEDTGLGRSLAKTGNDKGRHWQGTSNWRDWY